ncbi:cytochrome P450 [Streptomyces sp. NPDC002952]|uniref:cytochrome P450 n=1 Tax=Streptomyces sp. NPDC002952 TaxID=3364673 RepID=UPI00368A395D
MSSKFTKSNIPIAPGAVPGLGHTLRLMRDPFDWLLECGRAEAPITAVRLGSRSAYLVSDPDLVHDLLVGQVAVFDKGGPIYERTRELIGNGLGTASHERHRQQRRLMQPAFTKPQIVSCAMVMAEESNALTASWQPNTEIDLLADVTSTAMKVVTRTLLPAINAGEADNLADQFEILLAGLLTRSALPSWITRLPTPRNRRFERARADVWGITEEMVAAARTQTDSDGLLHSLISTHTDDHEETFSDQDLRDQVLTLLIGGTETIAAAVTWLFYLLTLHPQAEERLHSEIDTVPAGAIAGPDDLPRLPFTENVLLETMRLYPPVPLLSRISVAAVELGGHSFPAGTDFYFSAHQLHHDPRFFSNPQRFDPGRWDTPCPSGARRAYIPFGTGKRKCIGDTFAMTEAIILISAIASQWRLRAVPGSRVRPQLRATLAPGGLRLIAEPRTRRTDIAAGTYMAGDPMPNSTGTNRSSF